MGPNDILSKGYRATTSVPKYHVVTQTDVDACALSGGPGEALLGVCQDEITADNVTAGRVATVRVMGISRVVAGAAFNIGDRVTVNAAGRAVPAAAGNRVLGTAQSAPSGDGAWADVLLTPGVVA